MTRPIVTAVWERGGVPLMRLRFPGGAGAADRWITLRIRHGGGALDTMQQAAEAEVASLTPLALELLAESAEPAAEHAARESAVPRRRARYTGPVHCPACGVQLGRGNPALECIATCRGCGRTISARVRDGVVEVRAE